MNPHAEKIYNLALSQLNAGEPELAYGMGSSAIKQFPDNFTSAEVWIFST